MMLSRRSLSRTQVNAYLRFLADVKSSDQCYASHGWVLLSGQTNFSSVFCLCTPTSEE